MKLGTSGHWVGTQTEAGATATLDRSTWIHGRELQHILLLMLMSMEPWAATKKLYIGVAVTLAPV